MPAARESLPTSARKLSSGFWLPRSPMLKAMGLAPGTWGGSPGAGVDVRRQLAVSRLPRRQLAAGDGAVVAAPEAAPVCHVGDQAVPVILQLRREVRE